MKFWVMVLGLVCLSGCQSDPAPNITADMAGMTTCQKVSYALTLPAASYSTKSVAMEVGRNNGCFGQPQVKRVQIDQTVRTAQ